VLHRVQTAADRIDDPTELFAAIHTVPKRPSPVVEPDLERMATVAHGLKIYLAALRPRLGKRGLGYAGLSLMSDRSTCPCTTTWRSQSSRERQTPHTSPSLRHGSRPTGAPSDGP
jgi:hypothetical protein